AAHFAAHLRRRLPLDHSRLRVMRCTAAVRGRRAGPHAGPPRGTARRRGHRNAGRTVLHPCGPAPQGGHRMSIQMMPLAASALRAKRTLVTGVLLLAVAFAAFCVHLAIGGTPIPVGDVVATLFGAAPDARTELAILEFRLPRSVAAVLAGAGFGVAGALTQNVARNPLASPDVLGVTNGAALGAVSVLAIGVHTGGRSELLVHYGLPIAATLGGLLVSTLVFALVWRSSLESNRLVLVGLGFSGLCAALTSWMLTLGEIYNAQQALTWLAGTVNAISWADLAIAPAIVVPGLILAMLLRNQREVLALDSDTSRALGMHRVRDRVLLLALASP